MTGTHSLTRRPNTLEFSTSSTHTHTCERTRTQTNTAVTATKWLAAAAVKHCVDMCVRVCGVFAWMGGRGGGGGQL